MTVGAFKHFDQLIQALLPKLAVLLQPVAGSTQPRRIEFADAPLGVNFSLDQLCVFKHAQLARNRRARYRERFDQVTHTGFAFGEAGQNGAPCWVCQGGEGGAEVICV